MEQFRFQWNPRLIDDGVAWIVTGLFFKLCLADNLSVFFAPKLTAGASAYSIWFCNLLFGLRIYYDFAGYSLVALGLAQCLGVKLTVNFQSPYCSTSMIEFWRRWHVTLSQWFRDYLYIPLGGGRVRWWAFNVILVFAVSGLWHGAGWNFLLWGLLHGAALVANRSLNGWPSLPRCLNWLLVMFTAFGAWLCFYENDTSVLWEKFKILLSPAKYSPAEFFQWLKTFNTPNGFVLSCFLGLTAVVLLLEWLSIARQNAPYHYLRHPMALIIMLILTVLLCPTLNNEFIYFAF